MSATTSVGEGTSAALAGAGRPRRFGAWYVAQHRLRVMRAYLQTLLVTGFGNPFLYLFAMGVGLGSLVSANMGPTAVGGVSYLAFVAPALLCTAGVTVASWHRLGERICALTFLPRHSGSRVRPMVPERKLQPESRIIRDAHPFPAHSCASRNPADDATVPTPTRWK